MYPFQILHYLEKDLSIYSNSVSDSLYHSKDNILSNSGGAGGQSQGQGDLIFNPVMMETQHQQNNQNRNGNGSMLRSVTTPMNEQKIHVSSPQRQPKNQLRHENPNKNSPTRSVFDNEARGLEKSLINR